MAKKKVEHNFGYKKPSFSFLMMLKIHASFPDLSWKDIELMKQEIHNGKENHVSKGVSKQTEHETNGSETINPSPGGLF